MTRALWFMLLPALALMTELPHEGVVARQEEEQRPLPGVFTETLGRGPVTGERGDELALLRVTLDPGASIPASHGPRAAVFLLEAGRVGVSLDAGEAVLTLAEGEAPSPLTPGAETVLAPGDAVSYGEGTRLALRNRGYVEATMLFAAVAAADDALFSASSQDGSGTFGVETFACPVGMTLVTLETDACQPSAQPLIQWSLASDQFAAPLGINEATVSGATTTWRRLPNGTYFVALTADSFAPGYEDYFIPSSNQVTRQDERTTRVYYDAVRSTGSINAYVFTTNPSSGA